jgi:sugar O-acyltransferase (sialic acid O-acetyltransferase NeuD family)
MVLYGASGHGKVIVDILEANGIPIDFVVDDNPNLSELLGYEVHRNLGTYNEAIIAIGSCKIRKRVVSQLTVNRYLTARHPTAIISPHATIAEGSVVMQGAIIQACTNIGKHCIINTGASVDHDCNLADFVHVAPHATVAGDVEIGEGSWIGAGAVVKQGVKIGSWCVIGAGAVVVKDVPDNITVVGVPAKDIKERR